MIRIMKSVNVGIERAISILGSQKELAIRCGVKQPTISRYLYGKLKIPAETAVCIETITNKKVDRWVLRPDLW